MILTINRKLFPPISKTTQSPTLSVDLKSFRTSVKDLQVVTLLLTWLYQLVSGVLALAWSCQNSTSRDLDMTRIQTRMFEKHELVKHNFGLFQQKVDNIMVVAGNKIAKHETQS